MPTGIIASLGVSASVTYAPISDAKLMLAGTANGSTAAGVTVNGVSIFASAGAASFNVTLYVGAGIPVVVSTSSAATCIVSALEA